MSANDTSTEDMARPSNVHQDSPLLALPGELRNRIYHFCAESINIQEFVHDYGYGLAKKYDYRALTHVCKQLRREFRALYMAKTTIVFDWPGHFIRYSYVFFPQRSSEEMQKYRGDFVFKMISNEGVNIEFLPIFRLLAAAPQVRCTFDVSSSTTAYLTQLNTLFEYTVKPSSELWRHILNTKTRHIHLVHKRRNPEICFRMTEKTALTVRNRWAEGGLPKLTYLVQEFC